MKTNFSLEVNESGKVLSLRGWREALRGVYIDADVKINERGDLAVNFAPEIGPDSWVVGFRVVNFLEEQLGLNESFIVNALKENKSADEIKKAIFEGLETFEGGKFISLIFNFSEKTKSYFSNAWSLRVGLFKFYFEDKTKYNAATGAIDKKTKLTFEEFEVEGTDEVDAVARLVGKVGTFYKSLAVGVSRKALKLKNEDGGTFELDEDGQVNELSFEDINERGPFVVSLKKWETKIDIKRRNKNDLFEELKDVLGFKLLILSLYKQFLVNNGEGADALGLWVDSGTLFVDLSTFISQKSAAIYKAKEEQQLAIFQVLKEGGEFVGSVVSL